MAVVRLAGVVGTVSLWLSGCGGDDETTTATTTAPLPDDPSIYQQVAATSNLSTLNTALVTASLVDALNGTDELTLFAPVNDAFDKLSNNTTLLDCLLHPAGVSELTKVLTYHVVAQAAAAADLKTDTQLETLDKEKLNVTINDGTVKINDATVVKADINATNGFIHEIDMVLIPPNFVPPDCGSGDLATLVASSDQLTLLNTSLGLAELVETFATGGPFTVFAPVDSAFQAVDKTTLDCLLSPEGKSSLVTLLEYHVLNKYVLAADITDGLMEPTLDENENLTFKVTSKYVEIKNGDKYARVTAANQLANNGVAHLINEVLIPSNLDVNCTKIVEV